MRASSLVFALLALASLPACKPKGSVDPSIVEAQQQGAWAIYETLERRIEEGSASEADRQAALDQIHAITDDGTVEYAYARASVAGRAAQNRGLAALDLIEEVRVWAKKSIDRDPEFQGRAAQRMLGTLYVLAGRHLSEGDSEAGLELLEELVELHPDDARNHLRLAEGYVFLGDPDSAFEPLCAVKAGQASFGREERELLAKLIEEVGGEAALGCEGGE